MTTATREKATQGVNDGAVLTERRTPVRIVRELAATTAALYSWLSGPPATELQRSRATLAEVSNHQGRKMVYL